MIGCSTDADCATLGDVQCVLEGESAAEAQCGTSASWSTNGICLPRCEPGTCEQAQACAVGSCVPLALPESAFCSDVAAPELNQRQNEEELIALIEAARLSGGVACRGAAPSDPVAALRLDARLFCAARVFAADLAENPDYDLDDSMGRGNVDRLDLAGYSASLWAEGFVFRVQSANDALARMLSEADFCSGLVNPYFADIGIGFSGDTCVVTLGDE